MFDHRARRLKDKVFARLASVPIGWISPNFVTFLSLFPGIIAAWAIANGLQLLALLLFILNRILDGLDGYIARRRGLQSDFGGYLDILVDFVVYAAIPIGIWRFVGARATISLVTLLSVFYVNAASWMVLAAIIEKRQRDTDQTTTIAMPTGIVEGTETVLFYLAFLAFPSYAPVLFFVMAGATSIGVIQRLLWARRQFNDATT